MSKSSINRVVEISIEHINEALQDKHFCDALAFCLLVKLNVTSSTIKNATYRRLKSITRIGNDRLKRILSYCISHNLAYFEKDNTLVVAKLPKFNGNHCHVYRFVNTYEKRNGKGLQFNLTINKVKDMLRKASVAGQISKFQSIRETIKILTSNPCCLKEYKRGKRLIKRLSVWGLDFALSNHRLATFANCGLTKLKKLKQELIRERNVSVSYDNEVICENCRCFNFDQYNKYYGDDCHGTYLFVGDDGKVYKRKPNIYSYVGKSIRFIACS